MPNPNDSLLAGELADLLNKLAASPDGRDHRFLLEASAKRLLEYEAMVRGDNA